MIKDHILISITGNSMFPVIRRGSLVRAILCSADSLKAGDIVAFKSEEDFICHRLLKKIEHGGRYLLKTKGDSEFHCDPLVKEGSVLGKVVGVKFFNFEVRIDNTLSRFLGLALGHLLPAIIRPVIRARRRIFKR